MRKFRDLKGRRDLWACGAGFGTLVLIYILDATWAIAEHATFLPPEAHGDILHGALAMIVVGGILYLKARVFTPLREAFLHGYLKCKEDLASTSPGPDGGRVVHVPFAAHSGARTPGGGPSRELSVGRPHGRHARPTPSHPR